VQLFVAQCHLSHGGMERLQGNPSNSAAGMGPNGGRRVLRCKSVGERRGGPSRHHSAGLPSEPRRKHIAKAVSEKLIRLGDCDGPFGKNQLHVLESFDTSMHGRDIKPEGVGNLLERWNRIDTKKSNEYKHVLTSEHDLKIRNFAVFEK
jgi:hypothetical protein